MDVMKEKSIAGALAETERRLGPIDILVAGAGITGPTATVADYSLDDESTMAFLDRRLAGVGRIGRLRRRGEDFVGRFRPKAA